MNIHKRQGPHAVLAQLAVELRQTLPFSAAEAVGKAFPSEVIIMAVVEISMVLDGGCAALKTRTGEKQLKPKEHCHAEANAHFASYKPSSPRTAYQAPLEMKGPETRLRHLTMAFVGVIDFVRLPLPLPLASSSRTNKQKNNI
jgi:hypothetical protein